MEDVSRLIIISSHVPVFGAAGYALVIYRRLSDELKALSWYLFATGVIQLVSLLLWLSVMNNMPVLHVYVPLSFVLLCYFYSVLLKGLINAGILFWSCIIFTALTILNSVFLQGIFTFNSYALTLHSALVVILSLSAFIILLDKTQIDRFRIKVPGFNVINGGILIYHSSALLIFYFGNLITHSYSVAFNKYTWIMHSFLSAVMYLSFIFGLWKQQKR